MNKIQTIQLRHAAFRQRAWQQQNHHWNEQSFLRRSAEPTDDADDTDKEQRDKFTQNKMKNDDSTYRRMKRNPAKHFQTLRRRGQRQKTNILYQMYEIDAVQSGNRRCTEQQNPEHLCCVHPWSAFFRAAKEQSGIMMIVIGIDAGECKNEIEQ